MYGFGGVGLSEVQISISELSVVGGGWWTGQTHFMVGPGRGPTIRTEKAKIRLQIRDLHCLLGLVLMIFRNNDNQPTPHSPNSTANANSGRKFLHYASCGN